MSVSANAVFAAAPETVTKNISVEPGGTVWFLTGVLVNKIVSVDAKADQGNVEIDVVNDVGRLVARGTNEVNFRIGNQPGKFKIIIRNTTNNIQRVIVSYTATDDLWT